MQLLVPGVTYDQNLFNSSHSPNSYSYVYAATSRGYSTFVIDRLGTGLSDKPAPDLLVTSAHAYVVGQIVQKLRAGTIGGRVFSTVVGVGHSYGSGILQYLAGTATIPASIPDYLVLTSFLTTSYGPSVTAYANSLYAASSDPKYASAGLPSGYITTMPGTRDDLFLHAPGVEAAMPAYEESIKSLSTTAERGSIAATRSATVMAAVQRPVYIVVGQNDILYCHEASGLSCANATVVRNREATNFSHVRTCLSAYVVPNSGHSFGLHIRGLDAYTAMSNWIDRYTFSATKDANGCAV